MRSRLRRLAGSRLLDELDPSGERRADVLAGEPTISTYHAYAGRLVGEHALLLPAEPAARLLGQTAAWQLAHRVVTSWADELEVDVIPATVTGWLLALAGEMGEHLVDPAAVRAHAEQMIDAAGRGAARARGSGPSRRRPTSGGSTRSGCAAELLPLVEAFSARKRAERAVDFADQLAIAARVAAQHPEVGAVERATYRAVLLDEYQDTGYAQRVLLRALFGTLPGAPVRARRPGGHRGRRPLPVDLRLARGERGQPGALPHRLPVAGRAGRHLRPADQLPQPARGAGPGQRGLRAAARRRLRAPSPGRRSASCGPARGRQPGDVRVALLPDVAAEVDWMADAIAEQWAPAADAAARRRRRRCWCAAASTWTRSPPRCAPAGCRSRWSGWAGCSTPPRCATW